MKKHPATRLKRPAPAAPTQIPPLVEILARVADYDSNGTPTMFTAAYAAIPAFVATLTKGDDADRGDARYNLIARISGLAKATATVEERGIEATLANDSSSGTERAIAAILDRDNIDQLTELITPVEDAAFYVGFALAAYLLTRGGVR